MKSILSLDGGGSWAILQAMALENIYGDLPGRKLLAHFDLAIANSGGSIVLGALLQDKTPTQIIDLFSSRTNREAIFAPLPFIGRQLAHIPFLPKYSTLGKRQGLAEVFGAAGEELLSSYSGSNKIVSPSGDPVKFLVVAFGYDSDRSAFFRSYPTKNGGTADDVPVTDAINASSTAPIEYFDAPAEWKGLRSWDGAMAGLNNPLLAGVGELVSLGTLASDIRALSLGTGTTKLAPPGFLPAATPELTQQLSERGIIRDFRKAATTILDDPTDTATYLSHVLLSSAQGSDPQGMGPVVRLSPSISPVLETTGWQVPKGLTGAQFQSLTRLGMDAIRDEDVVLIKDLGRAWIKGDVTNQPIRMNSKLVGAPGETFPEGRERWSRFERDTPAHGLE